MTNYAIAYRSKIYSTKIIHSSKRSQLYEGLVLLFFEIFIVLAVYFLFGLVSMDI